MIATTDRGLDIDLHLAVAAAGGARADRASLDALEASVREAVVCTLFRRKAVTKPEAASALGVSAWELESEVFPRNGVFPNDGYGFAAELGVAVDIAKNGGTDA
ncbi:MAG: hypothetical protein HY928_06750 [Elusimicrobia bacterium]|nr:hypothetical protein [Elusimicrobiota bacterium]